MEVLKFPARARNLDPKLHVLRTRDQVLASQDGISHDKRQTIEAVSECGQLFTRALDNVQWFKHGKFKLVDVGQMSSQRTRTHRT